MSDARCVSGLVAPGRMPAFHEQATEIAGTRLAFKVTDGLPKRDPLGAAVFVRVAGFLGSCLAMQRTGTGAARRTVRNIGIAAVPPA
ncbi:hypothetical protein ACFW5S_31065 [Streptomyces olivaceus]|uniref:hypothetical protein n=1 Tax=Streptomyces olivaceus TaxID=47716 RepID=UPI0036C89F5B